MERQNNRSEVAKFGSALCILGLIAFATALRGAFYINVDRDLAFLLITQGVLIGLLSCLIAAAFFKLLNVPTE